MISPVAIAERYIAAWNEADPARRRAILAESWSPQATYIDPLASVEGHDGVDALIAGVQQRFPGFGFKLLGEPNGYGDQVRFSWTLGPAAGEPPIQGSDVVTLKGGRIASVIGFLDKVPAHA